MTMQSGKMRDDRSNESLGSYVLGIECGGTRSVAILADSQGALIKRLESVGCNLRLLSDVQLAACLHSFSSRLLKPAALGVGMAGVREEEDRRRVRRAAAVVWPGVPSFVGSDVETGLAAAPVLPGNRAAARVLLVSGTGSCCYGQNRAGERAIVGGWGHVLGDQGSGYDIGLGALKLLLAQHDRTGIWGPLGQRFLRTLQLNSANDLVDWAQAAAKAEIAALAVEVCKAFEAGDGIAKEAVTAALTRLADDAITCARRLAPRRAFIEFVVAGGVLTQQPGLRAKLAWMLHRQWKRMAMRLLKREGVWGAVELARRALAGPPRQKSDDRMEELSEPRGRRLGPGVKRPPRLIIPRSVRLSPTEDRNRASRQLDRLPLSRAIETMLRADATIPAAIRAEKRRIAQAIRLIVHALRRGGRLFYVGAGTSGRLGALDASECPPTFSVSADCVQAIMAGGARALWNSMEDVEDNADAGARAVKYRDVTARDVVVGISAGGRTPFVWGALVAAQQRRARTVLICFNPHLKFTAGTRPHIVIAPNTGPEVLTGSTRLRAGTATKMILNMFTTLAMVRLKKVAGNLMVDVNPTNAKLRQRAVGIVRELAGVDESRGREALEACGWRVKAALARLSRRAKVRKPGRFTMSSRKKVPPARR